MQHKDLASGRWSTIPFVEQMANIGSEVERSLNWRIKQNPDYSQRAFNRACELIDLTLEQPLSAPRLKEILRMREALTDFFYGNNQFHSTAESWRKYFLQFTYAARRTR